MKHFVVSDIHGCLSNYQEMMEYVESFDDYTLYFLGDAADRKSDGYKIMKELLANPHVVYLMGNHEDMFVQAAREFIDIWQVEFPNYSAIEVWNMLGCDLFYVGHYARAFKSDGGSVTFRSWIEDGAPTKLINQLAKLPLKASYGIFDMCHAGCTKEQWETDDKLALTWSRSHFDYPWYPNRVLIFGHTPVCEMDGKVVKEIFEQEEQSRLEALIYTCGNMEHFGGKAAIDCGCFFTGVLALFDLDSKDILYFSGKDN